MVDDLGCLLSMSHSLHTLESINDFLPPQFIFVDKDGMVLMINVLSNQAASSHVKRLVGERGDWEVEVERLRSTFSHQEEGWDFYCVGVG